MWTVDVLWHPKEKIQSIWKSWANKTCKILKFVKLIIHNVHWLPKTFAVESWHKHTSAWLSHSPLFWVTQTTRYWPVLDPGHFSTLTTAPNPQYLLFPVSQRKFHWKAWTVEFWHTPLPKSLKYNEIQKWLLSIIITVVSFKPGK